MYRYDSIVETLSQGPTWSLQNESDILEPLLYTSAKPGKEIRGKLIEAFNQWLHVPHEQLAIINKIVNTLHTASLLLDDIEDDSELRRGQPVAHKIYGIPQTVNCATYAYCLAYQDLIALREVSSKAINLDALVTSELMSLHRGQGLEILWRDSLQCPSEGEYIQMVNCKTGGLLRIVIKLMKACATQNLDLDYIPLVNLIGIHFQIRDDLMNLQSDEYTSNKGFAEDLTEGKFSFPIVHGIHADSSNRQILNILQKRPKSAALKIHAITYLRDVTKSFGYTVSTLDKLENQIRNEISRLGGNQRLEKLIDILHVESIKQT